MEEVASITLYDDDPGKAEAVYAILPNILHHVYLTIKAGFATVKSDVSGLFEYDLYTC